MNSSFQCLAVIVTYNPDLQLLQQLLLTLEKQVSAIFLVDNHSTSNVPSSDCVQLPEKAELLILDANYGLAYAHNLAIEKLQKEQFSHLLILDQDSLPASDMVKNLYQTESKLLTQGKKVAAIGPQFISKHEQTKKTFVCDTNRLFYQQSKCQSDEIIKAVHIISSGSLIRAEILANEKMEEDLFIEYIDVEWALRLKRLGYDSYACCSAIMEQRLGERSVTIPMFNYKLVTYEPLRYYYQFRNAVLLYSRSYIPIKWCCYHALRHIFIKGILLILFVANRKKNIKHIMLGLWHGLKGKTGAFEN